MRILISACRILTGLLFIFSGTVKAIDPLGTAYKFHDYFLAFNIGFLDPLSLPFAIIMITIEFIAGFAVLTGIRQKLGIWIVMILMVIFTPLTLVLALTNPVSDCGCFGDAIKLTNWETFGKNIILIIMAIFLFVRRKHIKNIISSFKEWVVLSVVIVLFILFSVYNLIYLPVVDFLPYKTGVNITEAMSIPEGAPADKYLTTFIYEKNGIQKEFGLDDYPANDTSWKFIDQKSVLIKKGYEPPIHNFSIISSMGIDITDQILSDTGYTLIMVSKDLKSAGTKHLQEGFQFNSYCFNRGCSFYVLTASVPSDIIKYNNDRVQLCSADETTIKTMIRANPGYILLKEGTIIGKWSWANLPEKEWFDNYLMQNTQSDKENL